LLLGVKEQRASDVPPKPERGGKTKRPSRRDLDERQTHEAAVSAQTAG
jgi:hypothetical protein